MAATRLIALHINKGKTVAQCLADRTDYSENAKKTNDGEFISSYMCDPKSCDQEFLLAKREYQHKTGRNQKHDVIAYQIRQSFKPGEVTPEEANRIGYETAMHWTKGQHAFIVATHIDRAHIHNHIIYNSTDISCSRKYRDFFRSGKALQKLSDLVCIENGLSVIEPKPYRERQKYKDPRFRPSMRDELRICIDSVFLKEPKSFEEFLKMLQENDYELKSGKHQAVRKKGGQKFIRFDSLGEKYTEENIRKAIEGGATDSWKTPELIGADLSLMVDIQKIISEKKGAGYEHWAKKFNLKQTAKVLCFLKENNIDSLSELKKLADLSSERFDELSATIKAKEKRIGEISDLKKHIFNYSKTRDTYEKYRKSGYSKKFYEANREELQLHKAAKEAFNALGLKKLPSVKELNEEFQTLVEEKRRAYGEYREAKEKMQAYAIARQNIEEILHSEEREKEQRKEMERIQ